MPQTAQEQLILELINRARLDPAGEAARLGITLNEGLAAGTISAAAKQPLAGNSNLVTAARGHSQHMIGVDQFAHDGIGDGTPGSRMTAAGYAFTGSWTRGENIAFNGTTGAVNQTVFAIKNHDDLFVDAGIAGRGHRLNILNSDFREVGIGQVAGVFTSNGTNFNAAMLTQDFAKSGTTVFVTGVAITDGDGDNFYDVGEGRGGITVTVTSGATTLGSDVTEAAGGYGAGVAPRTSALVTFAGGGLAAPVSATVTGLTQNVKVDLLGSNEILSSASTTLGSGAAILGLLGAANLVGEGNAGSNTILGNKGNNVLRGFAGNDVIKGLQGADTLVGGAGRDVIAGGAGNDQFRFIAVSDTGNSAATRDVIDFSKGGAAGIDKIHLAFIDAKAGAGTADDTFTFLAAINAAFTAQGQIRWFKQDLAGTANDKTIVAGNTDTNLGTSEFQIEIKGLVNLAAGDFIL